MALFDHRGLAVVEQAALYARAAVVIGVHGANFANVLWASEGCDVVEIIPCPFLPPLACMLVCIP